MKNMCVICDTGELQQILRYEMSRAEYVSYSVTVNTAGGDKTLQLDIKMKFVKIIYAVSDLGILEINHVFSKHNTTR